MTTITKEEYAVIPESLKSKFTASGDGFALIEEDVEGLKKSKTEILAEKKAMADKLAALEKFRNEYEQSKSADEEAKLKAAGEFAELEKKLKDKIAEVEQSAAQKEASLLGIFKQERLKNELTARGVLPDRAKYLLSDIADAVDLVPKDSGFELRVKNGIGDAKEFDQLIEQQKATSPFFFGSTVVAGSGADGGGSDRGGTSKTMARSAFEQMPAGDKRAFVKAGGTLTD